MEQLCTEFNLLLSNPADKYTYYLYDFPILIQHKILILRHSLIMSWTCCSTPCYPSFQLSVEWHQKYPLLCRVPGEEQIQELHQEMLGNAVLEFQLALWKSSFEILLARGSYIHICLKYFTFQYDLPGDGLPGFLAIGQVIMKIGTDGTLCSEVQSTCITQQTRHYSTSTETLQILNTKYYLIFFLPHWKYFKSNKLTGATILPVCPTCISLGTYPASTAALDAPTVQNK